MLKVITNMFVQQNLVTSGTDAILEVGSTSNAQRIFNHFKQSNINLFAQSLAWEKVTHFRICLLRIRMALYLYLLKLKCHGSQKLSDIVADFLSIQSVHHVFAILGGLLYI